MSVNNNRCGAQRRYVLMMTGNVFNLLVAVNCSVNFILYSSFSSKFRATFCRLVGRGLGSASAASSATSAALKPTPVAMTTVHAGASRGTSSQWILYGLPLRQQKRRMTCQIEYSEF